MQTAGLAERGVGYSVTEMESDPVSSAILQIENGCHMKTLFLTIGFFLLLYVYSVGGMLKGKVSEIDRVAICVLMLLGIYSILACVLAAIPR